MAFLERYVRTPKQKSLTSVNTYVQLFSQLRAWIVRLILLRLLLMPRSYGLTAFHFTGYASFKRIAFILCKSQQSFRNTIRLFLFCLAIGFPTLVYFTPK